MDKLRTRALRALTPLLLALALAACGGGNDDGASYSISVSPTSITLNGMTGDPAVVANLDINYNGPGVVVGTLPGVPVPDWITLQVVPHTSTTATAVITASTAGMPGNYSVTLRFATGKPDGSSPVYADLAVTFVLQQGAQMLAKVSGLVTGNSDVAVYGTRGLAAVGNTPGARVNAPHARDAEGNQWIFGGTDDTGLHNDLWKYDTTGQWTWISGSNAPNVVGNYGTRALAAITNLPGARESGAAWFDDAGHFWIFSGRGYGTDAVAQPELNDLWMYDIASDAWTWIGNSSSRDQLDARGVYGATNVLGARIAAFGWNATY